MAERNFEDHFKRRAIMFNSLVLGVIMCGMKLIGWEESAEVGRIQLKYIKWSPGLDWCSSGCVVLAETNRENIRIKAGRRVMKFEEGTKKHKIEGCQKLENIELNIEDMITDKSDQKMEKCLTKVERTRKTCRKEREEIG